MRDGVRAAAVVTRGDGPCDILAAAGTPCVAAHSVVRALYAGYTGPLYQKYNTALRGLSRAGEIGHVAEVLERMKRRKITPQISTYRAIINGTCDAGHTEVAMGYLDQLRAEGLPTQPPFPHMSHPVSPICQK